MSKENILNNILAAFKIEKASTEYSIREFGTGLIHKTFIVESEGRSAYILQRINHHVFRKPYDIVANITLLQDYLNIHFPSYPFPKLIFSKEGSGLVIDSDSYYRLTAFIQGTHSIDICTYPEQAYQASLAFGTFTNNLEGINIQELKYPIPGFHDLSNRFQAFEKSLKDGNTTRIEDNKNIIEWMYHRKHIVLKYQSILQNPSYKQRIIHHDTKISNVLFDENEKSITVIDLDTTMPGYCISDIGDMIRTYTSPGSEEVDDLDMVYVRKEFLQAILDGYREKLDDQLSPIEKENLLFGGQFMIYMQALRFFTDYLNNDVYYGSKYDGHNFVRTKNQMKLLESFESIISQ